MANWKYKLEQEGKFLRMLIDGEETDEIYAQIIDQLVKCSKRIMQFIGNEEDYDYQAFNDFCDLMDGEADIIRNKPEELCEMSFNGAQELVNERLEEFYDLCDRSRVWIAA